MIGYVTLGTRGLTRARALTAAAALAGAMLLTAQPALAQAADGSAVLLPLEAQTCNLPAAPARIPGRRQL